jgi:hypothetical protein
MEYQKDEQRDEKREQALAQLSLEELKQVVGGAGHLSAGDPPTDPPVEGGGP